MNRESRTQFAARGGLIQSRIEIILAGLTPRERQIAEKTLAGETPASISSEIRCSERTVERLQAKLQAKLESVIANS